MKEKDLNKVDDSVESPEKQRRIDIPLSASCRAMLFFHGDPNKACFERLHEYLNLMEMALLGGRRIAVPISPDITIAPVLETGMMPAHLQSFPVVYPNQHVDENGETRNQRKTRRNREKRETKRNLPCPKHPESPKNEYNHRCVECLREGGLHMQKAREAKLLKAHGINPNGNGLEPELVV